MRSYNPTGEAARAVVEEAEKMEASLADVGEERQKGVRWSRLADPLFKFPLWISAVLFLFIYLFIYIFI